MSFWQSQKNVEKKYEGIPLIITGNCEVSLTMNATLRLECVIIKGVGFQKYGQRNGHPTSRIQHSISSS